MQPIRYEHNIPIFSMDDIDIYGFPEHYGFIDYLVVASRHQELVCDYKMEIERELTKIHRYCRLERFKNIFERLVFNKGNVPENVIEFIGKHLIDDTDIWNSVRFFLKVSKWSRYYNQIPFIIFKLRNIRLFKEISISHYDAIINDFLQLQSRFDQIKHLSKRKYFPNIRFIVFKLLELHSIKPNYNVPFIRTMRKSKSLTNLWCSLLEN